MNYCILLQNVRMIVIGGILRNSECTLSSAALGEHTTSLGEHTTALGEHTAALGEHCLILVSIP